MLYNHNLSKQLELAYIARKTHTAAQRNDSSWLYNVLKGFAKQHDTHIKLLYKQGHNVPLYPIPNRGIVSIEYVTIPTPVMIQVTCNPKDLETLATLSGETLTTKKISKQIAYNDQGHEIDAILYEIGNVAFYGNSFEVYLETIHPIKRED